jgi:Bacterial archaeo-eukaryotic release factor family 2
METAPLSDVFNSPGPFATVLVDVSPDNENAEQEHELRVRSAVDALTEQGADESVVSQVRQRLEELVHRPAPVARVVVANAQGVLLDEVAGFRVERPVASYGPLPDLAQWVEHRDAVTTFVLALVDHEGGDVAVYDSDVPEPEEETQAGGETHHVHKVPVGGWSALRYQHVTDNVWIRNGKDVAAKVREHVDNGIGLVLLAGDPQSLGIVRDELADVQGATVVELESGTRNEDGGDEAQQQAIREALMAQAVERRLGFSHELKDRLGQDRAVATGVRDVADAFVRGQVETLLLDPQASAELTLDPGQHPGLSLGPDLPTGPVRADQALVAAAALTGAAVAVAPSGVLGGSATAALLRWDQ